MVRGVDFTPPPGLFLRFLQGKAEKCGVRLNGRATSASAAGAEEEIRDRIAAELGENGRDLVDRLVKGTYEHAGWRVHEMEAASAYLDELGAERPVTEPTLSHLRRLSA